MRYTGPKGKINRRLGTIVYDDAGALRAFEKRNYWPGMHAHRRRQISNFGFGLIEKQKVCHFYGMKDRQFRRFFQEASRLKGNTGSNFLSLCERRLDNVVCRAGLAKTRGQARQGVSHGHIHVNGQRVTSPSYQLKPNDVITIGAKESLRSFYKALVELFNREVPSFLAVDKDALKITVLSTPTAEEASLQVDIEAITEFVSR
ncbi:MAG: 30S ribosomal protein S4 [Planctomycetota bacterium]